MDRVEIGTYVSCVPGICFIGDFMVGTKESNRIGTAFLVFLLLAFIVPLIIAGVTVASVNPVTSTTSVPDTTAAVSIVIVYIVCLVALAVLYVAGMITNFNTLSKARAHVRPL